MNITDRLAQALEECLNRLVELSCESRETFTTECGLGRRADSALIAYESSRNAPPQVKA